MNNPSRSKRPIRLTLPMEEEIENDEVEMLSDLIGGFLDFFMTLINNILYKTSYFARPAFFFTEMFNTSMPVCEHVQVAEYIEMCSKKLVSLWSTNCLEGFQLNFMNQSIILQRFVFVLQGTFDYATLNKTKLLNILEEIAENARDINEKLSQNDDLKIFKQKNLNTFNRFQIVLGLNESAVNLYNSKAQGPFTADPDLDVFPWSKPKKRTPTMPMTPILEKKNKCEDDNFVISPSQSPSTLTTASKENSPSPETSRKNGLCSPLLIQSLGSKANILVDSPLPVEPIELIDKLLPSPSSDSKFYKDIHSFLISTNKFGDSLSLSFHGVTYTSHANVKLLTPKSKFSPKNIDSPGLYRSPTTLNQSSWSQMRRRQVGESPCKDEGSGSRASPLITAGEFIRTAITHLPPVSSSGAHSCTSSLSRHSNSGGRLPMSSSWRPRSARSLNQAFELSATSTLSSETQMRLKLRLGSGKIRRP